MEHVWANENADTLTESLQEGSTSILSASDEVTSSLMESGSSSFELLWIILVTSGGLVILSCLSLTVIIACSLRARKAKRKLLHLLESANGQS